MAELRKEDLWVMADKLRNNMDSAEYKHVCLGLISVSYTHLPEATYDTLEKYGSDLVERARDQKLDPVIGRDSEIRCV